MFFFNPAFFLLALVNSLFRKNILLRWIFQLKLDLINCSPIIYCHVNINYGHDVFVHLEKKNWQAFENRAA